MTDPYISDLFPAADLPAEIIIGERDVAGLGVISDIYIATDPPGPGVPCAMRVEVTSAEDVTVDVYARGKQVTRDGAGKEGTIELTRKPYQANLKLCGLPAGTTIRVVACELVPGGIAGGKCSYVERILNLTCEPCAQPAAVKAKPKLKPKAKPKPVALKKSAVKKTKKPVKTKAKVAKAKPKAGKKKARR